MVIEQRNNLQMMFILACSSVEKKYGLLLVYSLFLYFASSQFLSSLLFLSLSLCLSFSRSPSVSVSLRNNNRSNHKGNTLNGCDEGGLAM